MIRSLKLLLMGIVLLCVAPVLAQGACPAIVETALQAVDEFCQDVGRNQACYGNVALEATAQAGAADFRFEQIGDITDVAAIQTLRLFPMDETTNTWGVVLMRLQANLPDTLPGQNVTFLLFGDVEITNAVPSDSTSANPMQAFYLTTGVGDSRCAEAPSSGLLVQTPQGVGDVGFTVNGVNVSMGSTVLFRGAREGNLTVSTIEGAAALEIEGEVFPVLEGARINVPMDENLIPGLPEGIEPYDLEVLQGLPIEVLEEEIEIALPITEEEAEMMEDLLAAGEAVCDDDPDTFLPTCDHLPSIAGGEPCIILPEDGEALPQEWAELPTCAESESEEGADDAGNLPAVDVTLPTDITIEVTLPADVPINVTLPADVPIDDSGGDSGGADTALITSEVDVPDVTPPAGLPGG